MSAIVRVKNLSHRYAGGWAVHNVNFEMQAHGVLGLLGPNGAGKSTTMNILCGVLRQTQGIVLIDGVDMLEKPEEAKKLIGFLPQAAPLYLDFTVDEYLRYSAALRLIDKKKIGSAVEEVKERCGIAHFSKRLIRNLSGGYRQRCGIAQAIIHHPRLVVLDEPTNGLDPNQILEVRSLIHEISQKSAVLLSSHILSEVQATCSEIVMVNEGRMVFCGKITDYNNYLAPCSLTVRFQTNVPAEQLLAIQGITGMRANGENFYRLFFEGSPDITQSVLRYAAQQGWPLSEINLDRNPIETIFARLSGHEVSSAL